MYDSTFSLSAMMYPNVRFARDRGVLMAYDTTGFPVAFFDTRFGKGKWRILWLV